MSSPTPRQVFDWREKCVDELERLADSSRSLPERRFWLQSACHLLEQQLFDVTHSGGNQKSSWNSLPAENV